MNCFKSSEQRGFAFIELENRDQAENAIHHLDNTDICGYRVTITVAKNNRKSSNEMRRLYDSRRYRSRSGSRGRHSYYGRRRDRSYSRDRHSRRDRSYSNDRRSRRSDSRDRRSRRDSYTRSRRDGY